MGNDGKGIVLTKAGSLVIWEGWLFGPVVWAVHQNVSYGLTPVACDTGATWPLFLATLLAVAVVSAAGYASWRLRQSFAAAERGEIRAIAARARFIAMVGVLICALSAIGILVETIPVLMLDPCPGAT